MKDMVILALTLAVAVVAGAQERPEGIVGGVNASNERAPIAVRHDTKQPGEEIVTLRYFKIQKGTFDEFLRESKEGVWPFFEKIGSRVVGMWQLDNPQPVEDAEEKDYDEVYLMTRYASVDHWRATRDMAKLGGNGPDYERCLQALQRRWELTLETNVVFLRGETWENPPQFLPAVEESK